MQIGAGFRGYKSGEQGLQIGAPLGISNWGRDFISGQRDFKSGQERLQTGAGITNQYRTPRVKNFIGLP